MKIITLLLMLIVSSNVFPQSGWQVVYQSTSTPGQYFKDITFFDNQTGWVLGGNNVLKTTNSGMNWQSYLVAHSSNQLNCFYFYNKDIGWAAENNFLNFTSNSGSNWSIINTSISNPRGMFFRDLQTGWVCGDSGKIKKTTNGGFDWFSMPSGTSVNLRSIAFADNNIGICAGDWGIILSTTNGGLNWSLFYDNYLGFYSHVKFRNSQTGFVTGTGGNIYRTTNSGANWNPYYISSFLVSGIHFTQNGNAYAFGSPGIIHRSTNTGSTWEQIPANGLFSQINCASITSDDNIWAAADSGFIYNSTNLGNSWSVKFREYLTKEHLNSVYFINHLTGFACGDRGILISSTNGGTNWLVSNLGSGFTLKDIQFVNDQTGFIGGWGLNPKGVIFRTSNAGGSWQTVYNDTALVTAIHFLDPNTGWAAGSAGYYLKTTNSGVNWVRSRFETMNLNEINFIDNNTGFISKIAGLYRTTNGGSNWMQISANHTGSVQFAGNTGYAYTGTGSAYFLLKTTNSGNNWSQYQVAGGQYLKLYFTNEQTGWIIAGNSIRKTTNGGINWFYQASGSNSIYGIGLHFIDNSYGWCVGMYGGIMRTTTGGIGITTISTELPTSFTLFQNYPNPFNPVTKIRFSIPYYAETTRRVVSLRIYDILGKEIAVLVNENLKPGIYEAEWNASDVSSGIYFYSLFTNNFTQTKKMVVLK